MVKNPLLKYTTEQLLHRANPEGDFYFKKTTLNKVIYLLYLRLKERGIDIHLPYFWFKYGTLADERLYEDAIGLPFSHYFKKNGSTRAMTRVPHSPIDPASKSIIDDEIDALLLNYKNANGFFIHNYLQLILNDVYATAPYEFQRTFNRGLYKYIEQFLTLKRKKIPTRLKLDTESVSQIKEYLSRLITDFPMDDFPELSDLFLEWEDTMQLALKYNHVLSLKLLDEFWEVFARSLRPKQNENIPEEVIDHWTKKYFEEDLIKFEHNLSVSRSELLLKHLDNLQPNDDVDNMVSEIMDYAFNMSIAE